MFNVDILLLSLTYYVGYITILLRDTYILYRYVYLFIILVADLDKGLHINKMSVVNMVTIKNLYMALLLDL